MPLLKYLSFFVSIDHLFPVGFPVFIKAIRFCVCFVGRQIANAAMWSFAVVKRDAFPHNTICLVDILEGSTEAKFIF